MQFTSQVLLALGLIASASAHPLEGRDVQVAHFTFHGGPASYDLAVPADGSVVITSKFNPPFPQTHTQRPSPCLPTFPYPQTTA